MRLTHYDLGQVSNTTEARMDRAIILAGMSTMRQKHGAILYKGGRALSVGINTRRNIPADHIPYEGLSIHAEVACISALRTSILPREIGGKLYVARISAGGNLLGSKPCVSCLHAMEYCGVSEVIYT